MDPEARVVQEVQEDQVAREGQGDLAVDKQQNQLKIHQVQS